MIIPNLFLFVLWAVALVGAHTPQEPDARANVTDLSPTMIISSENYVSLKNMTQCEF